jgi:hypothetical protein
VGVLIWKFSTLKKKHMKRLIQTPSILVLEPKSLTRNSIVEELTKNEVLPDPVVDHLRISYLRDGGQKFQVLKISFEDLEHFKEFNVKSVVYVIDPFSRSFKEQVRNLKRVEEFFNGVRIFPIMYITSTLDGKRLEKFHEMEGIYPISMKTKDGLEEFRKSLLSSLRAETE